MTDSQAQNNKNNDNHDRKQTLKEHVVAQRRQDCSRLTRNQITEIIGDEWQNYPETPGNLQNDVHEQLQWLLQEYLSIAANEAQAPDRRRSSFQAFQRMLSKIETFRRREGENQASAGGESSLDSAEPTATAASSRSGQAPAPSPTGDEAAAPASDADANGHERGSSVLIGQPSRDTELAASTTGTPPPRSQANEQGATTVAGTQEVEPSEQSEPVSPNGKTRPHSITSRTVSCPTQASSQLHSSTAQARAAADTTSRSTTSARSRAWGTNDAQERSSSQERGQPEAFDRPNNVYRDNVPQKQIMQRSNRYDPNMESGSMHRRDTQTSWQNGHYSRGSQVLHRSVSDTRGHETRDYRGAGDSRHPRPISDKHDDNGRHESSLPHRHPDVPTRRRSDLGPRWTAGPGASRHTSNHERERDRPQNNHSGPGRTESNDRDRGNSYADLDSSHHGLNPSSSAADIQRIRSLVPCLPTKPTPITMEVGPDRSTGKNRPLFSCALKERDEKQTVKFTQRPVDPKVAESAIRRLERWEPFWEFIGPAVFSLTCPVDSPNMEETRTALSVTANVRADLMFTNRDVYDYIPIGDWGKERGAVPWKDGDCALVLRMLPLTPDTLARADCHLWPKGTFLQINGKPTVLEQRRQQAHDMNKWHYISKHLDVTAHVLDPEKSISIEMCCYDTGTFLFCLSVCRYRSVKTLCSQLIAPDNERSLDVMSRQQGIKKLMDSFKRDVVAVDSGDEGDGQLSGKTVFSLKCPISKQLMSVPVRRRQCKHWQVSNLVSTITS